MNEIAKQIRISDGSGTATSRRGREAFDEDPEALRVSRPLAGAKMRARATALVSATRSDQRESTAKKIIPPSLPESTDQLSCELRNHVNRYPARLICSCFVVVFVSQKAMLEAADEVSDRFTSEWPAEQTAQGRRGCVTMQEAD